MTEGTIQVSGFILYDLLVFEEIILEPNRERFSKAMNNIKAMMGEIPIEEKVLLSRYYAFTIHANKARLIEISKDLDDSQKRGIVNLSEWTGLVPHLRRQYEGIKSAVEAIESREVDDVAEVTDFYRSMMDGTCPDFAKMQPAQKLYWKLKSAKALTDLHYKKNAKPSGSGDSGSDNGTITPYDPEKIPSLNDPDVQKSLEEGERILSDGDKTK